MSRDEIIEVLRQAYEELEMESSPTADELAVVILQLAQEWSAKLEPRP